MRKLLIVLAALAVLVLLGRIVLDPIAARLTRRTLDKVEGFKFTFSEVHVGLLPPSYEIRNFKIIEQPAGRWDEPLVFIERAQTGLVWRKLLHGQLVTRALIVGPKLVAVRKHEEKAKKAPDLGEQMNQVMPLKLDRLEVVDGEVLLAQGKGKKAPQLWIHKLNLVATNLATREAMMDAEPATLDLGARVQRSGVLKADAKMNPWTAKPTFTAEAALEKLDARELYAFLADQSDLKAVAGEINLYVKVKANNGVLSGGVKPMIKGLELESASPGLGSKFKEFLADATVDLLSDDNKGRDAVAAVIPIRGTLDRPDTQALPTVLGAIRSAFVVGLSAGFTGVPPKTAEKKEGVIKQAFEALKPGEGPPEAQPTGGKDGDQKATRQGHKRGKTAPRAKAESAQ